jgi:C-terminal processing protease CtpA/Prc
MNIRSTVAARSALLALAAALAMSHATAAEGEKKAEQSPAELREKLEDARRRLDAAVREVTELQMSMSDHMVPHIRHVDSFASQRAMLGINVRPDDDGSSEGVPVVSVSPGGAAESAGLKAGDVLLAINDKPLKRAGKLSPRDVLMDEMEKVKPGEKVTLRYRRDNKVAAATVTAQRPDALFAMPAVRGFASGTMMPLPAIAARRAAGVFGSADLVPLTPQLGKYFGTEKGLLVVRAPSDSRLKLEDGDVIVDIDGRVPSSPSHAFRILGSYQAGETLKLSVLREKKKMTFDITIPDEPTTAHSGPLLFHHELPPPEPGAGNRGFFLHRIDPDGPQSMTLPAPPEGPAQTIIIADGPV